MNNISNTIKDSSTSTGVLKTMPKIVILELVNNELKEKERDVIIKRFGLKGKDGETLEQIGRKRGVTRERIRQIEKSSINKLRKVYSTKNDIMEMKKVVLDTLKEYGNLMEESHLLTVLLGENSNEYENKQAILFSLYHLFDEINLLQNHPDFHNSWHTTEVVVDQIINIISQAEDKIKQKNEVVEHAVLEELISDIATDNKHILSYINATKRIEQNNFGQWGLATWSTVSPKRVGDKVYLILKKTSRHMHFTEITDFINEAGFNGGRTVNEGTVHNELIMDDRYVLIGRGVYALKEWGYAIGTVSEIIIKLLKERGAMHRDEIIKEVATQRLVRENTIKVCLMNKKIFKKVGKQKYFLADNLSQ